MPALISKPNIFYVWKDYGDDHSCKIIFVSVIVTPVLIPVHIYFTCEIDMKDGH